MITLIHLLLLNTTDDTHIVPSTNIGTLDKYEQGGCEKKSALFIFLIFHSKNSQNSNLSLK